MTNTESTSLFELRQKLRPVTLADLTHGVPTLKNVYYRQKRRTRNIMRYQLHIAAHQQETSVSSWDGPHCQLSLHGTRHTASCLFMGRATLPAVSSWDGPHCQLSLHGTGHTASCLFMGRATLPAVSSWDGPHCQLSLHGTGHTASCLFATSVSLISSCNKKIDLSAG